MKVFKPIMICTIAAVTLSACAAKSNTIQPAYVSPVQYQGFSCSQIRPEMARLSRRVNEVSGIQDKQAGTDAAALGVGLVLFWPALFFMTGSDQEEELARLKGEYEALEQTAIAKNCDISKELKAAREMEQSRVESDKAKSQPGQSLQN